jgi:peptidoglycan hydrolase-like protein with peptidoglycan-binding domain
MAATVTSRTFTLTSPHMAGEDVRELQRLLNRRFAAWKIGRCLDVDGDYGTDTREAVRQVCRALGFDDRAAQNGVSPRLRTKIRHPERRSRAELARSRSAAVKAFRAQLRAQFKLGSVVIAPGANKPGQPIQAMTLDYVRRMSALIGKPITITTGTNHDKFTTSGNVSDHFTGHAADIGMAANGGTNDGPVGDRIMAAALTLAGVPAATAREEAHAGGLFNNVHNGMRIQCIWKTDIGGNHHNHVHVGVRPA